MNEFCNREAIPVVINGLTLYCEKFKALSSVELHEQPTVDGVAQITNRFRKTMKFTFTGRIYNNTDEPFSLLTLFNSMGSFSDFTINYRGMKIEKCIITNFTIEDKNEDFVYISVIVSSPHYVSQDE
ncbi:MAG: hypothetical protein K2K91_08935 [Ruminococcus sp.]|nr:hypothetical protein [Ruminococcus sp.]